MRGSIEKYTTASGDRWRIRYELPTGADGRRRQRSERGFKRERDAARALREILGSIGWSEVNVISERLGHASIGITLDTYSHVLPDRDVEIAATLATYILGS